MSSVQRLIADEVQARPAQEFVDTVGIGVGAMFANYNSAGTSLVGDGTHLASASKFPNYATLVALAKKAGFQVFRIPNNTVYPSGADGVSLVKQLVADTGAKLIYTIDPPSGTRPDSTYWAGQSTPTNIEDYLRLNYVSGDFWAAEMCNEIDNPSFYPNYKWHPADTQVLSGTSSSPYYWGKYIVPATVSTAQALDGSTAAWIKALPLIGPTLVGGSASYLTVGDLSQWVDHSGLHPYMSGRHPETVGWGGTYGGWKFGSLGYNAMYLGFLQAPGRSAIATEGGNPTTPLATDSSSGPLWTWDTQGVYLPRYYLGFYRLGLGATVVYNFDDDSSGHYGILDSSFNPKPAFSSVTALVGALKDTTATFVPNCLNFTVTGSTANVNTLLLQKANGDFYLCFWIGVSREKAGVEDHPGDGEPDGTIYTVPNQAITVTIPTAYNGSQVRTYDTQTGVYDVANAPRDHSGGYQLTASETVSILHVQATPTTTTQIYEAERLQVEDRSSTGSGTTKVFTPYYALLDSNAGEGIFAQLAGTAAGNYAVYQVPNLPANLNRTLTIHYRTDTTSAQVQLYTSDSATGGTWTALGSVVDTYSSSAGYSDGTISAVNFGTGGTKYFKFVALAKDAASTNYSVQVDRITVGP